MAYVDATQAETVAVNAGGAQEKLFDKSLTFTAGVSLSMTAGSIVSVAISQSVGVAAAMAVDRISDGLVATAITFTDALTTELTIEALMATLIQAGFTIPTTNEAGEVWVLNLDTGAFSRYTGFVFNSFGMFDGRHIAAKEDGVYLLEGADDDGTAIQSMIDFGRFDFGSLNLKHISNAYVGLSSDGAVYLKVVAEGTEYVYAARAYDDAAKTQRFDIGKGIRTNFLDFELYGNGSRFELTDIEFIEIPSVRRI